jgi:hypothetical protein
MCPRSIRSGDTPLFSDNPAASSLCRNSLQYLISAQNTLCRLIHTLSGPYSLSASGFLTLFGYRVNAYPDYVCWNRHKILSEYFTVLIRIGCTLKNSCRQRELDGHEINMSFQSLALQGKKLTKNGLFIAISGELFTEEATTTIKR